MSSNGILADIIKDVKVSRKEKPWPVHIVAQAAMISDGAGKVMSTALKMKYQTPESQEEIDLLKSALIKEAKRTCADTIRFIESL